MKDLIKALGVVCLVLSSSPVQNTALDYEITQEDILSQLYEKSYMHSVDVTMYHPVEGQTDSTPNIVADGTEFDIASASTLKWIAVSRDLHVRWGGELGFRDIVYLQIPESASKSGYYLVKDTMNERWTKRIDILESPGMPIFKFTDASLYLVTPQKISRNQLWFAHLAP
ncbi:MAG: hypothetical protein ACQETE_10155 [Bacteroidota bacterium]